MEEKVKPFLKWAGGKQQLINEIKKYYPFDGKIRKYAEPFIGGGAILFDILNKFELEEIYISDVNKELINTYLVIKENVNSLIEILKKLQEEYISLNEEERKKYYLEKRKDFNTHQELDTLKSALMIFLNKTCFNGLYRVNKKGLFNVPSGRYKMPLICDENNLLNVSKKIKKVKIICDDYSKVEEFVDENTFIYFDPPYRPITTTSAFTSYTKNNFDDKDQIELSKLFERLDKKGGKILLSNSDPKNTNEKDNFFETLYANYKIKRIEASRMINSKGTKRGKINEILISNF